MGLFTCFDCWDLARANWTCFMAVNSNFSWPTQDIFLGRISKNKSYLLGIISAFLIWSHIYYGAKNAVCATYHKLNLTMPIFENKKKPYTLHLPTNGYSCTHLRIKLRIQKLLRNHLSILWLYATFCAYNTGKKWNKNSVKVFLPCHIQNLKHFQGHIFCLTLLCIFVVLRCRFSVTTAIRHKKCIFARNFIFWKIYCATRSLSLTYETELETTVVWIFKCTENCCNPKFK